MTRIRSDIRQSELPLKFSGAVVLLLVVAAILRFYRLDDQLWLDEISALKLSYSKSFWEILTVFPGLIPSPLYDLMAHAGLKLIGETAVAIRLPAALFGLAGVVMFYRLARRLSAPGEALFGSLLLAVSYHHIFFSQNARPYTLYLFLSLASTELLLTLFETGRWHAALAYSAVAALTTYALPLGLFVPAGQLAVALPLAWFRRRRRLGQLPSPAQIVVSGAFTALIVVVAYAPFIARSVAFSQTTATMPAHGPRVLGLLPELLEGLRAAFFGWPGVIAAAVVGSIGLLSFARRKPLALALLIAPLVASGLAVGVMDLGIHSRYFLWALPVGYLVASRGLVCIAEAALRRIPQPVQSHVGKLQAALAVLTLALAALPLIRYYSLPKQDYLGALREVRRLSRPQDRAVAAHLAGHVIRGYYAPEFPVVEDLTQLRREEASGQRVWVVTTLERVLASHDPDFLSYLRRHYRLVRVLPGSLGDGAMRIYVRDGASP